MSVVRLFEFVFFSDIILLHRPNTIIKKTNIQVCDNNH